VTAPIDAEATLTEVERAFLRTFRKHGPLLALSDLGRLLRREGHRVTNAAGASRRIPFVTRYRRGVYGIADEGLALALEAVCEGEQQVRASGPTAGGGTWIEYELTPPMVETGASRIPDALCRRKLREPVRDRGGKRIGTALGDASLALGLRPWLERCTGRPGQRLRLWRERPAGPLHASLE
jgi:hypothetical protein